jgi:hypothetical protein
LFFILLNNNKIKSNYEKIVNYVIVLLQLHAAIAQNKTEDVTLTDMLKIKTVGNITVSKDGKRAAFTVNTIENDENNKLDYKYRSQFSPQQF